MRRWVANDTARLDADAAEEQSPTSDAALELLDVPAAVVCAHCGDPACAGCLAEDEPTGASGIVAIIPWERPGLSSPRRMWSTAKLSTLGAESFFSALPDGEVGVALRFAVLAELLAVTGMCVVAVPIVLAFAPWVFDLLTSDVWVRSVVVRGLVLGIPGLALLMVALHASHGLSLSLGASRAGTRAKPTRGLRFGLYSCGWDLVTLPAGLAVLAVTDGFAEARRAAPLSLTVPRRATLAFLSGVYRLDADGANRASRFAILLTTAGLLLGGLLTVVGLVVFSVL